MRAGRKLKAEYSGGISTIAFHADTEGKAMFVGQADKAGEAKYRRAVLPIPLRRRSITDHSL